MFDKTRNVQKTGLGGKPQTNIPADLRLESAAQPAAASPGSADGAPEVAAETAPTLGMRWATWAIVALALVLRLLWLGMKPPHFDEGVNGWFVDQMTKTGFYHYDPGNYHGPFHFYVLFLMQTLFGRSVVVERIPLVLINTATVWLVLQFRRFFPWKVCVLAALAMAVSPGMLFYSRYAIHEAWFVFGMILALWGALEMWKRGSPRGLWAVVSGVTLLMLTKETFIMHLTAFGLAVVTLAVLERFMPSAKSAPPASRQWDSVMLGTALLVAVGAIIFFFSGAFLDPQTDYLQRFGHAFVAWAGTGVKGNGHEKPFFYWFELMGIYEWPAFIGLLYSLRAVASREFRPPVPYALSAGAFGGLLWVAFGAHQAAEPGAGWHALVDGKAVTYPVGAFGGLLVAVLYLGFTRLPPMSRSMRLIAIYACGALAAYCIVPYKTPWCIVSIIWPFLFLFGDAIRCVADGPAWRRWCAGLLAALTLSVSLVQSVWLNYMRPVDPFNSSWPNQFGWSASSPSYVYVQTLNDYFKLMDPLNRLVKRDPTVWHAPGHVLLSSYHPLPWVLGDFTNIGFYEKAPAQPDTMDGLFILADPDRIEQVERQLNQTYFVEPFHLRDAMLAGKLYLNYDRFKSLFPGREPEFDPATRTPAQSPVPAPVEPPVADTVPADIPSPTQMEAETPTATPVRPVRSPIRNARAVRSAGPSKRLTP